MKDLEILQVDILSHIRNAMYSITKNNKIVIDDNIKLISDDYEIELQETLNIKSLITIRRELYQRSILAMLLVDVLHTAKIHKTATMNLLYEPNTIFLITINYVGDSNDSTS